MSSCGFWQRSGVSIAGSWAMRSERTKKREMRRQGGTHRLRPACCTSLAPVVEVGLLAFGVRLDRRSEVSMMRPSTQVTFASPCRIFKVLSGVRRDVGRRTDQVKSTQPCRTMPHACMTTSFISQAPSSGEEQGPTCSSVSHFKRRRAEPNLTLQPSACMHVPVDLRAAP